jgi:hypothetical protein
MCFYAPLLLSCVCRGGPLPVQARANGSTDRLRAPLEAMRLLRQVLPLLVLGGGRLATHWVIDYQVRHGMEAGGGETKGACVVGLRQWQGRVWFCCFLVA